MLLQDLLDESSSLCIIQFLLRLIEQGLGLLVAMSGKVVAPFFEFRLTAPIRAIGFIGIGLEITSGDVQGIITAATARAMRAEIHHLNLDVDADFFKLGLESGYHRLVLS